MSVSGGDYVAHFQSGVDSKGLVPQTTDAASKIENRRVIDLERELDTTRQKLHEEVEKNFYLQPPTPYVGQIQSTVVISI